jgi:squalene cyclase
MKIILAFLLLLPVVASAQSGLNQAMENMATALVSLQKADGRFEGTFEADPGFELLSLVLLKKYNQRDLKIEKAFIQKAMKWKTNEGFGYYPKAPYAHDVTGLVLISLKALGYDLNSLGLSDIEKKFNDHGGAKDLNFGTKILLAPLGLASSKFLDRIVTVSLLGIPEKFPMSQKSLGIFRSLIVPLSTWNYFKEKNTEGRLLRLVAPGDKKRALEGIKWILHHQMPNGTWYTLFHTIVNVSALAEAEKAGVGNYQKEIKRGLEAVKNWRTINSRGEITQQLTLTTGWDTPQTLIALSELPSQIKDKYKNETRKAIRFLDKNQITEKGDWAVHSPDLKPGGWSFIVENRDYPDTDVVAAVLEAKLAFPEGSSQKTFNLGLNWVTGLQNKDGGFPAWEKGVSPFTDKLIKTILPDIPDYSDLSQSDVTSRITRLLYKLKDKFRVDPFINEACHFIRNSKEDRGPFWKGRWLVAYLYGTAEAIDTLATTDCSSLRELEPSISWLVKNQNIDGGFGEAHSSFDKEKFIPMSSTVMQTSYVVHGLLAFEEKYKRENGRYSPYKKSLDRAISYLIDKAKADNWLMKERSFTGVIGAKLWYSDYALSPQFMTLRALGRYSRLAP